MGGEPSTQDQDPTSVWGADPIYYNPLPTADKGPRPFRNGPPQYAYPAPTEQLAQNEPPARKGFEYGPQTVPLLVGGEFVPFLLPSAH